MVQFLKENSSMGRSKVEASSNGQMAAVTEENSTTIRSVAMAFTLGQINERIKGAGSIIRWMASVSSPGRMVKCIEDNIRMTSSMVTGSSCGQTENDTKECGEKEFSTDVV